MSHLKQLRFMALFILIAAVGVSCGPKAETTSEADLQRTLQAIYADETLEAADSQPPAVEVAPTEEPQAEPTAQVEFTLPGEPPEPERTLEDVNSSYSAAENKATAGDNILNGLYERPFTSQDMVYQPDLDITTVDFGPGEGFFYFTIRLYGMNNDGGGLQGLYGIEFDRTLSGRGDLLVTVKNPAKEWSTEGVTIYGDDNRDVGGPQPVIADAGFNGSGYNKTIQMDSDRNAFARIDPQDGNAVQIAVSYPLVEVVDQFLWGAWADNGLMDPAQFDYNDRMGPTEAGSPIKGNYYPVKALYNLDNTCRLPFGMEQTGLIVGMCKIGVQPEKCTCLQWYTYNFGEFSIRVCIKKDCNSPGTYNLSPNGRSGLISQ